MPTKKAVIKAVDTTNQTALLVLLVSVLGPSSRRILIAHAMAILFSNQLSKVVWL